MLFTLVLTGLYVALWVPVMRHGIEHVVMHVFEHFYHHHSGACTLILCLFGWLILPLILGLLYLRFWYAAADAGMVMLIATKVMGTFSSGH